MIESRLLVIAEVWMIREHGNGAESLKCHLLVMAEVWIRRNGNDGFES